MLILLSPCIYWTDNISAASAQRNIRKRITKEFWLQILLWGIAELLLNKKIIWITGRLPEN